jgi:lipoprotein-releasing system permease protein
MPYEVSIALRYLTARRKQAFISVISLISILGVTVGVMALMIALGLMTGLQGQIRSRILGTTAHLSIFRSGGEPLESYRAVLEKVRRLPAVKGAAPTLYDKGLLTSASASGFATLKGINPADERTVTELQSEIHGGALEDLKDVEGRAPPVLLGHELASKLGVGVGDVVTLTSTRGRLSPVGLLPRVSRLRVVGTVRSGLYEFDSGWAYLPLSSLQRLQGSPDEAGLIEVRIEDMYAVKTVAKTILGALGEGYLTTDWIDMNGSLFQALWLEKTAIGITIGLIVLVAALNIVATLILMVMEKNKDIAILVSMGASAGAIARIFVLQGTIIGTVGTLTGAGLGGLACFVLDHFRLIRVPEDVYQVSYVPFRLLPGDAAVVVFGAILICFLATIHPALGASRLDPAEALRYE